MGKESADNVPMHKRKKGSGGNTLSISKSDASGKGKFNRGVELTQI